MGEIRIVHPGKTPGYPYPVCKKIGVEMKTKSENVSKLFSLNYQRVLLDITINFEISRADCI